MDNSSGWLPCAHEWVDVSTEECEQIICNLCGEVQDEAPHPKRGGWRVIETYISAEDGLVKLRVVERETGRTVYAAAYEPHTARDLAFSLTLKALEIEDQ